MILHRWHPYSMPEWTVENDSVESVEDAARLLLTKGYVRTTCEFLLRSDEETWRFCAFTGADRQDYDVFELVED